MKTKSFLKKSALLFVGLLISANLFSVEVSYLHYQLYGGDIVANWYVINTTDGENVDQTIEVCPNGLWFSCTTNACMYPEDRYMCECPKPVEL